MFDQTILQIVVLTMLILTCKGTGAIPGQTPQRQMPSGIRLVQVSLQQCIQVYFLIRACILPSVLHWPYKPPFEYTLLYSTGGAFSSRAYFIWTA